MKKTVGYIFVLSVLSLLCGASIASELTGRVTNSETGNPVSGVNIRLIEQGTASETNHRGFYRIRKLSDGQLRLIATHVGFDASDTITVTISDSTNLDIALRPSPWVLNDVVITGTRSPHLLKDVPVQTEVVSQRDFQRTGATTVDEALASSIGININEDLSGQGATIRGIEGDRVLILVDGERAVGRVRGSIDLGQYALSNVEKIEVVKGTGSTLYGSDAMGGVINIITRKPPTSEGRVGVYFDGGSHNSLNPSVEGEYGNLNLGFSGGLKYYSTDGFDLDPSTPHTNGQEMIDRFNFNGKLRERLSDKWSATQSVRLMHEERNWIEYEEIDSLNKYNFDDIEVNKRYSGSASFDYMSGENYSMKTRFFVTYYNHNWDKYNGPFWVDTSRTEDLFWEFSYSANRIIGDGHMMTYGLDYNYQDLISTEMAVDKVADKAASTYFQYEYSPGDRWNFLPGIRYEHHSSFGGHVNPSINIMHMPAEGIKVRGFVGKGFRAPSIKQQFYTFDHTSAGYVVYGGEVELPEGVRVDPSNLSELTQENSINSSISAELSYGTMGLHRITYFYNHLEGLIDFKLVDTSMTYWRGIYVYQNIETAITQGIEWESRVRMSKSVDFSFSYNYLYTRDLNQQRELINRPKHVWKFYLTGTLERYNLGASFWGDYQSEKLWRARTNTGGNENPDGEMAPHRTRLNLNLFKRFGSDFETFVKLENILDETEVNYGYWPGFEIFAGFKYSLQLK